MNVLPRGKRRHKGGVIGEVGSLGLLVCRGDLYQVVEAAILVVGVTEFGRISSHGYFLRFRVVVG